MASEFLNIQLPLVQETFGFGKGEEELNKSGAHG